MVMAAIMMIITAATAAFIAIVIVTVNATARVTAMATVAGCALARSSAFGPGARATGRNDDQNGHRIIRLAGTQGFVLSIGCYYADDPISPHLNAPVSAFASESHGKMRGIGNHLDA